MLEGSPTAFITGASGFVGSHVARRLLGAGWRVRALVRDPLRPGLLPGGCEVIAGAIHDEAPCLRGISGCDLVVHAAGATRARSLAQYAHVNAEGTRRVARAAREASPDALFLLISSQAAAGPSRGATPRTEGEPPAPISWYGRSKLAGEEALLSEGPGRWLILRPCAVYGAGDPGLLELFRIVARGFAPSIAGGRQKIELVYAEDLARAVLAAATRNLTGRRLFVAGDEATTGEVVAHLASLRRRRPLPVPIPAPALWLAALAETVREAVTGKPRPFNRDKAREMLAPAWVTDGRKTLEMLEIGDPLPWREGIARTAAWYVREGWVPDAFSVL